MNVLYRGDRADRGHTPHVDRHHARLYAQSIWCVICMGGATVLQVIRNVGGL